MLKSMMIGVAMAVFPASAAFAQAMPVADFLAKVEALEKLGPLAAVSPELGLLKAEIGNSSKAVRADQIAADKAGRKLAYCLPAKASMTSEELVAYFVSIPAAERTISVGQAFRGFVTQKYPCKG
ncbi:hypothetical protein [Sphingomonas sp.]|uniref:hypothetical protein n=1 Tax=Sphingomonas sp. TaxID=28214 RepID=UPI00286E1729|nr:hypothetical protein [Sphingomonas sp.]